MKRFNTIIIAITLVLGMTQCKKNVETISTPVVDGNWVDITLNVGGNSKHDINTNTGAVTYTSGDVLYVGNNGKYVGSLTYNGSAFTGSILNPSEDDYLCFYFLGGLTPEGTLVAGTTTSLFVNISNQTSTLPVLSYGRSLKKYKSGDQTYTAILGNKCALVKFNTNVSNSTVVLGVNHSYYALYYEAQVSFIGKSIEATGASGAISIHTDANGVGWAILLECEEEKTILATSGTMTGSCTVPELDNNDFYDDGVDVVLADRRFSVAADKQVRFSSGNLQYNPASHRWRFAEHQYDIATPLDDLQYYIRYEGEDEYVEVTKEQYYYELEHNIDNIKDNYVGYDASSCYTSSFNGWIDLFGWGTGSYPLNISTDDQDYLSFHDWGNSVAIDGLTWRTLTGPEWFYVFRTRTTTSNMRFVKAVVADIPGVILFPDEWDADTYTSLTHVNDHEVVEFDVNVISESVWNTTFESNGAIFLPAAGSREATDIEDVAESGFYWTSSCTNMPDPESGQADLCRIVEKAVNPCGSSHRSNGYSVRLVSDVASK